MLPGSAGVAGPAGVTRGLSCSILALSSSTFCVRLRISSPRGNAQPAQGGRELLVELVAPPLERGLGLGLDLLVEPLGVGLHLVDLDLALRLHVAAPLDQAAEDLATLLLRRGQRAEPGEPDTMDRFLDLVLDVLLGARRGVRIHVRLPRRFLGTRPARL